MDGRDPAADESGHIPDAYASRRERIYDWIVSGLVAIGIVASIPTIPLLVIAWIGLALRSPGGVYGTARAASNTLRSTAPGRLEGFSGRMLFPIVAAGWLLIGLLAVGVIGTDVPARAWTVFFVIVIVPTFLVYRSMHPEMARVPIGEWLARQRPGPVGIVLLTWVATMALVGSVITWTSFIGGAWPEISFWALMFAMFGVPIVLIPIGPRGGPRLYRFVAVSAVIGLVTAWAYLVGLTPPSGNP